ncbi:MAG: geranylgeranylglyceryl/heptaprenylglyceryl phosphate synthase [Cytophagales bacterium]|nr:geranylgeranylglyceryl/heptaprenylglyceryl phosphate synthase [Cytophagales bacterium]
MNPGKILHQLLLNRTSGRRSFAVLVDPDKTNPPACLQLSRAALENRVDFFLVGGSLLTTTFLNSTVRTLKAHSDIPVILFPGSNLHIDPSADAILLLSLISGRNPDFLIGQHVIAAPVLRKSKLEILPTGYMLIESGKPTTVSYISNTTPIPYDKPEVAACTAMAGEMLGLQLIYLDAGSGAQRPVSPRTIAAVRKSVEVPIVVGGGIATPQAAEDALQAGADVIVIGNGIEKDPNLLVEVSERISAYNKAMR